MFSPLPAKDARCRILYISPIKALAVDVERNLRTPIAGIARVAEARGEAFVPPTVAIRTGDTPARERARFQREPADILITTPESLFLLLSSRARAALASVETVIVDEIHALVPTKRGAHLALSIERLEQVTGRPLQRIGLSATQRPLDEVARFLGGTTPRETRPRDNGAASESGEALVHDEFTVTDPPVWRPVTVVDARAPQAAGAARRGPGRRPGARLAAGRDPERPGVAGSGAYVDLGEHPPATARADPRAPIDAPVREQPAARGAAGDRAQRAGRRAAGAVASRLDRAGAAHGDRGRAEDRTAARPGRDLVARARHRHGGDRSRRADRGAAIGRQRPAAHRARQPPGGRRQHRRHLPEVSRRPGRLRGGHRRHARGQGRVDAVSAQPSRRAGAADRRDGRHRGLDGRGHLQPSAPGRAVRRTEPPGVRERARHAVGPLPVGRIRRAAPTSDVGSRGRNRHGS